MTENELDIQTILTKRTAKRPDRVLLCGLFPLRPLTDKKEKANSSHFLKFLSSQHTFGTFAFAPTTKAHTQGKSKRAKFPRPTILWII